MANAWKKHVLTLTILTLLTSSTGIGVSIALPADHLGLLTQPSGAVSGVALVTQPVIQALDSSGNLDLTFTGNVSVAIGSGTATLSGVTTVAAVAGVATFTGLVLTGTAGSNTLTFTSAGLTGVTSSLIVSASRIFRITYDGNSNTGGSAPSPSISSGPIVLAVNSGALTRTNYIFSGWNTSPDGSGSTYGVSTSFTPSDNISLYAYWIYVAPSVPPTPLTVGTDVYVVDPSLPETVFVEKGKVTAILETGSGTAVIVDGKIVYTPNPGFKGNDSFTYRYQDITGAFKTAIVNVTVPNQAPEIDPPTDPIRSGNFYSVQLNVNDPNGDRYTITLGEPTENILAFRVGNTIRFRVPNSFSGKVSVPVAVTDSDGAVTQTNAEIIVNPESISNGKLIVIAPQKKTGINQTVLLQQKFSAQLPPNATNYEIYVNGILIFGGSSTNIVLPDIIGAYDIVDVIALGKEDTKSIPTSVDIFRSPISIANVNFESGSSKLTSAARELLRTVASRIIQHGFTRVDLTGFVDSVGSRAAGMKLSTARAAAVKNYLAIQLADAGVSISAVGLATAQAVGNNKTQSGRALNRRVEIKIA